MVQVDVFWAYGLGAGYAMAAARQIKKLQAGETTTGSIPSVKKEEKGKVPFWKNTYFISNLLYLGLLFAPSGLYLVWQFTSWETMHAGDKTMPGWLVALFGLTNISQGILGFWVVWKLIEAGKNFLAYLQVPAGYFGMFFILVHGWDGTGYKRFFSESVEQFQTWTWGTAINWLTSDVAITLYVMGVILIPVLIVSLLKIEKEGWELGGSGEFSVRKSPSGFASTIAFLATVFVGALGFAIISSVIIHQLGWILGAIVSTLVIYILGISKFGLFQIFYKSVLQSETETAGKLQSVRSAA